jgi:integrase
MIRKALDLTSWEAAQGRVRDWELGIVQEDPHRFRDTFSAELLLAGVPIEDVSILLGRSSVRITERAYSPWVQARQQKQAW